MDRKLQEDKQTLRNFMRAHYTDERLTMLLAHARDGKLAFYSCCCFIGIPTASHALQGETTSYHSPHYLRARTLEGAEEAETAYCGLYLLRSEDGIENQRRRRLIPIIKAEIRRRDRLASTRAPEKLETLKVGVIA